MSTASAFFDLVDRLDAQRHDERRVLAQLNRGLRLLDADGLAAFQQGLEGLLERARTAELWGAANLIHGPLAAEEFDAFATWLACQGSHAFQRVLRMPDEALELLTRAGRRRRRPGFPRVLEAAWRMYRRRFGADLYERLGPLSRVPLPLVPSPEGDPDERWPHPAGLELVLPKLWQAFGARGLRLFPLVEDCSEVCACCGRVHAYAYGVATHDGEPLASYTLHWTEGEWASLESMIHLAASNQFFGLQHRLDGNGSGSALLDVEDAPFTPDTGSYVDREAALQHPRFALVSELARLTLVQDPNARRFWQLWNRRRELAPVLAERLAQQPLKAVRRRCAECGEVHDETEVACEQPDELLALGAWQRRLRLRRNGSDELVLDGRRRFRRGVVPVPVKSREEPYCYGVWIEQLDPSAGTDVLDSHAKRARLQRGPRGLLANDLLFFPETTLGLEVSIQPGEGGERPRFRLDPDVRSPLAREQRKGMPARRPRQLMGLFHQ